MPLHPENGRALEVDWPQLSKGLPPRAGDLGGHFSLLGGVNSTEEAGIDRTDLSDAGFCGEELPLHPENKRSLEVGWPRLSKGLPPRAEDLSGRFSLLGGVNLTEEADVD